jgi:DNA-3-methyladenine glycosylase
MYASPADAHRIASGALPRDFFARPTDLVARDLLGVWLMRESVEGPCAGQIVETEAYGGPDDLASHARAGRTRRTTPMFGQVGHAYVYLVYGMHECLNVVAYAPPAEAGAVLIRAIEPLVGVELMRARRGRPRDPVARLCSGPAKLCQAMGVGRDFDGHDLLTEDTLRLAAPDAPVAAGEVAAGPRVGVAYAGADWSSRPWRFWLAGHPSVSRP